jgi:hypothetical protein
MRTSQAQAGIPSSKCTNAGFAAADAARWQWSVATVDSARIALELYAALRGRHRWELGVRSNATRNAPGLSPQIVAMSGGQRPSKPMQTLHRRPKLALGSCAWVGGW